MMVRKEVKEEVLEESVRDVTMLGPRKLWTEVLKLAIMDMQSVDVGIKQEAFRYMKSDETEFPSFISVCTLIGIDPFKLREVVLSKVITRKTFMKKLRRCCGCGHYFPVERIYKVDDGMYACKKCKETEIF